MKAKILFIVGAFALTFASISAQAQAITGTIDLSGGDTIDAAVTGATTFETFFGPSGPPGGPVVQAGAGFSSGSYSGIPGNTATSFIAPFDFDAYYQAYLTSTPVLASMLWSFSSGGENYSFQVNTVSIEEELNLGGSEFINIGGTGTGTITGTTTYAPTPETWSITATSSNPSGTTLTLEGSFTAVPEPSTLAFAGLGSLLSIVTIRRRK